MEVEALMQQYDRQQRLIRHLIFQIKEKFETGDRSSALQDFHQIRLFDLTHCQKCYLAKLAFNHSTSCMRDSKEELSVNWMKESFDLARELNSDGVSIKYSALLFLIEAFGRRGDWVKAEICADLLPLEKDPFRQRLLKLWIAVENQSEEIPVSIDTYFFRCLTSSNFDSLSQGKELLNVLLSAKLNGSFHESTYFEHLFDETRRRADLSTDENEEIFSIQITYHLERGALEQAFSALSSYIQWLNKQVPSLKESGPPPSTHLIRVLDFCHKMIEEKLFAAKNYSETKKWAAALVFLCSGTKQPIDRFIYYLVESCFELDGHEGAQKVLKGHRNTDPENPTIIRLQFDMALKHGDVDTQMELLLDNHRYMTLVENFPTLRSAVIEFISKAMTKMKTEDVVSVLEGACFRSSSQVKANCQLNMLLHRILIRLYLYLWSTQMGEDDETDSDFVPKLVSSLSQMLECRDQHSVESGSPELDNSSWISKMSWNIALQAKSARHRHDLFRISSEALAQDDESRISCRTIQIAVAISHLMGVGSFEDEEHRLVTSVAKAIDDCDVTFSLIEKSPFFDIERVAQAKRFLSIYSLKLTLLTFSDISTNVDKIVNNLTREADSLGLQLVIALLSEPCFAKNQFYKSTRVRCLKAAIEITPKTVELFPVCQLLLDELLTSSLDIQQQEIGNLVQMLIWICQNDSKAAQGPLELAITKMWNFGIRLKMIRDHRSATQMLELAQALMDWCPDFKKRNEEKIKIGIAAS